MARVNGFAIGGGKVLETLCDLTIAATPISRSGRPKGRSVAMQVGTAFMARTSATRRPREISGSSADRYTRRAGARDGPRKKVVSGASWMPL